MRRARRLSILAGAVSLASCSLAFGFDLPADLPVRAEGLWRIDRTGTITDGKTTFEIQKIWNVCLDAKADRALHALEVYEQQASVAGLKETCEGPQPAFAGNTFSWTMHCAGPSPIENKTGKTDIRHTTTFVAGDQTQGESVIINRDNLVESDGRFLTRMQHLGACEAGTKPADMTLMHWRVNGEETLKARQKRDVYSEIEYYRKFTASRLQR